MTSLLDEKYFKYLQISNDLYLSRKLEQLKNNQIEDFNKFLNLTQSFLLENKEDLIEYIAYIGYKNSIINFKQMPKILIHCDGLRMLEKIIIIPIENIDYSNDDILRGYEYAIYNLTDCQWEINKSLTEYSLYNFGDTYSSLKLLFEWNWIREDFVSTDAWNYEKYISKLQCLDLNSSQ